MLTLVATPIGRTDEISYHALTVLREADVIICESTKETSKLLKQYEIKAKRYEVLDEHTGAEDVKNLVILCQNLNVALVTDCGTPSFCDPGFQLVALCRKINIEVKTALGPSSLMGLLSLSSEKINEFHFRGFLPAETAARESAWQELKKSKIPVVLMDTPYRLQKLVSECVRHFSERKALLVLNLSQPTEQVLEGPMNQIVKLLAHEKAEFMILIYGK